MTDILNIHCFSIEIRFSNDVEIVAKQLLYQLHMLYERSGIPDKERPDFPSGGSVLTKHVRALYK